MPNPLTDELPEHEKQRLAVVFAKLRRRGYGDVTAQVEDQIRRWAELQGDTAP